MSTKKINKTKKKILHKSKASSAEIEKKKKERLDDKTNLINPRIK